MHDAPTPCNCGSGSPHTALRRLLGLAALPVLVSELVALAAGRHFNRIRRLVALCSAKYIVSQPDSATAHTSAGAESASMARERRCGEGLNRELHCARGGRGRLSQKASAMTAISVLRRASLFPKARARCERAWRTFARTLARRARTTARSPCGSVRRSSHSARAAHAPFASIMRHARCITTATSEGLKSLLQCATRATTCP